MRLRLLLVSTLVAPAIVALGVPSALADELPSAPVSTTADVPSPAATGDADPTAPVPSDGSVEATDPTGDTATPTVSAGSEGTAGSETAAATDVVGAPTSTTGNTGTAATDAPAATVGQAPVVAAAASQDPRATIGDIDCSELTIEVTLDNSRSAAAATFDIAAGDINAPDPAYDETFVVPAGAKQTVAVPVVDQSELLITVVDDDLFDGTLGGDGTLAFAIIHINCDPESVRHDPRATIGDANCATLTVPVTLDNTRSGDETTFAVLAGAASAQDPSYQKTFAVPAGGSQVVQVPVKDHTQLVVGVGDDVILENTQGEDGILTYKFVDVSCAPVPAQRPVPSIPEQVGSSGSELPRTGGVSFAVPVLGLWLLLGGGGLILIGRRVQVTPRRH